MQNNWKKYAGILTFAILTAAVLIFIFSNSVKNGPESQAQSGRVIEIIKPILDPQDQIPPNTFNFIVRKMAHGTEFCMLGIALGGLAVSLWQSFRIRPGFMGPFLALSAAVTDEFIQSFTGRTSSVRDVVIDFSGAAAGFLLAGMIWLCIRHIRKRRKITAEK